MYHPFSWVFHFQFTSDVYKSVLPGSQHHGQSRPLDIWEGRALVCCYCGSLLVGEHADLSLVEHHLREATHDTEIQRKQKPRRWVVKINALTWTQSKIFLGPHKKTLKSSQIIIHAVNIALRILSACQLTANFSGGIIEMARGVIPSICSFTKADMAMSGSPAA